MQILIVEDDSLFAEILQTFIDYNGCVTTTASSLASAKACIQSEKFDLILLDNHLPDGDGISYLGELQNDGIAHPPIIMITGDDNQNIMVQAFDKGADDYLVKPLSLDLLWQKIQRVHRNSTRAAALKDKTQKLELMLDQQRREEDLARYVYEHVANTALKEIQYIDTYLQSSSTFNGDVFICDTAPNGNQFVILADATGHGLSAAISILPLVNTIRAMIRKGLALPNIIHEANSKLCAELPGDKFVAVIAFEINYRNNTVLIFNGGMPEIVCLNTDQSVETFPSKSMALGILDPCDFDPSIVTADFSSIKNFFFFSDGLIEQQNPAGEAFGMHRVLELLKGFESKEPLLSKVVNHFSVFNELLELQDDLSICDIQVQKLIENHKFSSKPENTQKNGKISASINLSGNMLAKSDLIGIFDSLMQGIDMVGDLRQKAFTVFAELISNALDHGVLGLDSKLKNDFTGFAEYIELKEQRMANINQDDRLDMALAYEPETEVLNFTIRDSGQGYDVDAARSIDDSALSGRGMALINKLCTQVSIGEGGSSTSVTLKRDI